MNLTDGLRAAPHHPDRVVVLNDFSAPSGGAEMMALRSAELLAEAGISITFVTGDDGRACPLRHPLVTMATIGRPPVEAGRGGRRSLAGLYDPAVFRVVADLIARIDTPRTVYHLHNWTRILSPAVFRALRPVENRLFLSAHDFGLVCPNLSFSNYQRGGEACPLVPLGAGCLGTHCDRRSYAHKLWRAARSAIRTVTLPLARSPALVGIIHPDQAPFLQRGGVGAERLRVVRNPIRPFTRERVEAERNEDLFFIGRVVSEKGVDLAVEAARLVGRRLRVIGDGDLQPALAAANPHVRFEGWRSHAEIGRLIGKARALLVPSRLPETFTLVAHEAMCSGVPVVSFSDVDGREAAAIGAAIVVPPRSARSLADGIATLDAPGAIERISRTAFAEGHRFSNTDDTWREALLACYEELIQQSVRPLAA